MLPEQQTGESRSDRKRAAIVEAAIAVFQAQGFANTSMDAIAAAAGVSKRTVYNHFASKEDLFKAIASTACQRVSQGCEQPWCPETPLEAQLTAFAEKKVDLLTSDEFLGMARVTLMEHLRRPELAAEAFEEIERSETDIVRWIRAAVAAKRLAVTDPRVAGKQLCALLHEFAFWPQLFGKAPKPSAEERRRIVSDAVRIFLDHYRV